MPRETRQWARLTNPYCVPQAHRLLRHCSATVPKRARLVCAPEEQPGLLADICRSLVLRHGALCLAGVGAWIQSPGAQTLQCTMHWHTIWICSLFSIRFVHDVAALSSGVHGPWGSSGVGRGLDIWLTAGSTPLGSNVPCACNQQGVSVCQTPNAWQCLAEVPQSPCRIFCQQLRQATWGTWTRTPP